jgi:hypothetical protein
VNREQQNMTEKKCPYCNKYFMTNSHQRIYCSDDCGKAMRAFMRKKSKPKPKKKTVNPLRDIAIEARKHGMSYGQYVAHMNI